MMRSLIFVFLVASAIACGADVPSAKVLACAHVAADAERLSCYDKLAAGLDARQSPSAGSAGAQAPNDVGPRREFGLPAPPSPSQEVKAVTAIVTATHQGSSGGVVIDLDNGQRWQQTGQGDMGLAVGDVVTISRALLGSFWLEPPGGRGSKVRRLK